MDASGKDGTIERVLDPLTRRGSGCRLQTALSGGAAPRLPLAQRQGAARARLVGVFKPLLLRRRVGGAGAPGAAGRGAGDQAQRPDVEAGSRTSRPSNATFHTAAPRGQVLPARIKAEQRRPAGPAGPPGQELEVSPARTWPSGSSSTPTARPTRRRSARRPTAYAPWYVCPR